MTYTRAPLVRPPQQSHLFHTTIVPITDGRISGIFAQCGPLLFPECQLPPPVAQVEPSVNADTSFPSLYFELAVPTCPASKFTGLALP